MPDMGSPTGIVYGWDGTDLQAVMAEALGSAKQTTDIGLVTAAVAYGWDGSDYSRVAASALEATAAASLIGLVTRAIAYGWDGATYSRLLVESSTNPNLRAKLYDGANAIASDVGASTMGTASRGLRVNAVPMAFNESDNRLERVRSMGDGDAQSNSYELRVGAVPYLYNGSTYDRARSYGTGIPKQARAEAGLSTNRIAAAGAIKVSAGSLYWLTIRPSAANWVVSLDDSTDGSAATKWDIGAAAADGIHIVFDPPMEFAAGIYAEALTNITSITAGYL